VFTINGDNAEPSTERLTGEETENAGELTKAPGLAGEEPARNGGATTKREVELLSWSSEARTERLS
jgi:hypothetical protein